MYCNISGQVTDHPVVSTKSGHVYDKQLIERYIDKVGKCPATG
ncbi:hypothetical protein KIPB_015766, partial [Kipferlia bialata]|eukprot:g15766.t1